MTVRNAAASPPKPILAHSSTTLPVQTGHALYTALPDGVWLSHAAAILQNSVVPFTYFWFKPLLVLGAVMWLSYRAFQVIRKPLEELATFLGFDLPTTPVIDLASVRADGAIVHWSLPEAQKPKATMRFEIHLNGTVVDTLPLTETAATITGLLPGAFYMVRVSLVCKEELSSKSAAVRFRTKPASSNDFFSLPIAPDVETNGMLEPIARVRPFRGLKGVTPAKLNTAPMARESSTSLTPGRTATASRRPSPSTLAVDQVGASADEEVMLENARTLQELTEKLDAIRCDTDEAERQAKDEDEDEMRQREDLIKERDELKAVAVEKEKASRTMKREVNTLERQNTTAQNEKTKHERSLLQKQQDRQKAENDALRWEREAIELKDEVGRIKQAKEQYLEKMEKEKEALRTRQAQKAASVKVLDEEVREKTAQIKKLERAMKNASSGGTDAEPNLVTQYQLDEEDRQAWYWRYTALQKDYTSAAQSLEELKRAHTEQSAYLESLRACKRQEDAAHYASSPSIQDRVPRRGDSQRSRRAQSGQSSAESPRSGAFTASSGVFPPATTASSSIFKPFLNHQHGMMLNGPTDQPSMADDERERMTGGAPMSPGAGMDLLPTDLFNDDSQFAPSLLPGLGIIPGLPNPSAALSVDHPGPGPASPASASSRSASVFASPHLSQQNLHLGSPEHGLDADRHSVHSARSGRAPSGGGSGSRFSGMFGIKQRSKTSAAEESLALGKTHSRSMPKQDQGLPGIDSATRKRNSSISGLNFSNAFLPDRTLDGTSGAPRRKGFGIFGKTDGGWPSNINAFGRRPESPRPASTHSSDLPRPSFDSSRWVAEGWPSVDGTNGARSSPLAFGSTGVGWNPPPSQQSRIFGSRHNSRRPSGQYGASGPPEDILEDSDSDDVLDPDQEPHLPPIGTKPTPGSKRAAKQAANDAARQQLNPNAKDFKSLFSGIKPPRDKGKESGPSNAPGTPDADASPPDSRKSRDTRGDAPSSVAGSLAGSGRTSFDLALTSTYSNSDPTAVAGSAGKESFMQKLTRKSSSGKFALPNFKRDKNRLDPGPMTPTSAPGTAEEGEEQLSASVGSLRECAPPASVGKGSGRNWGSVLKLGGGKRKGNETPSLSGLSLASGTTEEGEEGEEE